MAEIDPCLTSDDAPAAHYADENYGGSGYMAISLEGHTWYFGSYRPDSHWGGE
jgi:hypothetical protein